MQINGKTMTILDTPTNNTLKSATPETVTTSWNAGKASCDVTINIAGTVTKVSLYPYIYTKPKK